MSNRFFPTVEIWRIPEGALEDSLAEMARDGRDGNEGICLWLGHRADGIADITHVVALRGPGVVKAPDYLRVEAWLLNDLTDRAIALGTALVGHIHTHGWTWTDLSYTDRAYGIGVPSYLSVVAPHFGLHAGTTLADCGVHVFEAGSGFRRLAVEEVRRRVHLIAGVDAPLVTVGEP